MKNKEITFYISTGYVGSKRSETCELTELLCVNEEELSNMTEEFVDKEIDDAFRDWVSNCDMGWYFEDE